MLSYILDIIPIVTAHLSTAGIHQNIMFLVALADMGETRRCRIKCNSYTVQQVCKTMIAVNQDFASINDIR